MGVDVGCNDQVDEAENPWHPGPNDSKLAADHDIQPDSFLQ